MKHFKFRDYYYLLCISRNVKIDIKLKTDKQRNKQVGQAHGKTVA